MLSDEFREMLDNDEAQMLAIRADCARFAAREDGPSTTVHKNILTNIDELLALTRAFRKAALSTHENQREAYQLGLEGVRIGGLLSSYMRKKADCAGPFRRVALQNHADTMSDLARDKILVMREFQEEFPSI